MFQKFKKFLFLVILSNFIVFSKPINKKTVPSSKISMLVEQPKYKLELDKYKNPKKVTKTIKV